MTINSRHSVIVAELDQDAWKSAREIGDAVAESPAFSGLASIPSRQRVVRRLIGKLVALGAVETDDRMGAYGMATYVRRLPVAATVH
jgi:hypothetical protein